MKTVYDLHRFWTSTSAIFGLTFHIGRMTELYIYIIITNFQIYIFVYTYMCSYIYVFIHIYTHIYTYH